MTSKLLFCSDKKFFCSGEKRIIEKIIPVKVVLGCVAETKKKNLFRERQSNIFIKAWMYLLHSIQLMLENCGLLYLLNCRNKKTVSETIIAKLSFYSFGYIIYQSAFTVITRTSWTFFLKCNQHFGCVEKKKEIPPTGTIMQQKQVELTTK